MRFNINAIVDTLPDVATAYEIVVHVNLANGVNSHQWPKPSNTHSWSEIYAAITAAGYKPTFAAGYGRDRFGKRVPTLLHVFSILPTLA